MFNFEKKNTEVCGFLDITGKFYTSKEERDKENKRISYNKKIQDLGSRFDYIITHIEDYNRRSFELKDIFNISDHNKLQILTLFAEYLKLEK